MKTIKSREEKQLDPDLDNETAKILIAFCLKEKLHYPKTKKMYLEQSEAVRIQHLSSMKQVAGDKSFNYETYKRQLANFNKN